MLIPERKIFFNEELHKYTDEYNNVYTSVTQLIGKFEPVFDIDKWSKYKAKERGVSQETILLEWKHTNKVSIDVGNNTHKHLEDSIRLLYTVKEPTINQISEEVITEKSYKYRVASVDQLNSLGLKDEYPQVYWDLVLHINNGWVIYAEKRVYNPFYFIAGTIDCFLVRGNEFKILDWKTNKKDLKFESGYYKKEWQVIDGVRMKVETNTFVRTKEYLAYPLNNVQHCKGNGYTLQLSTYAYLVEQFGLRCVGLTIYHIKSTDVLAKKSNKISSVPVKKHIIQYKKEDVFRMLEHHRMLLNTPTDTNKNKFTI
jgi:hypothetical protein